MALVRWVRWVWWVWSALWLGGMGCADQVVRGPAELSIAPAEGEAGRPLSVIVQGRFLEQDFDLDYGSRQAQPVDSSFDVRIGDLPLEGLTVLPLDDIRCRLPFGYTCCTGTVSAELAPGRYDLVVKDARGQQGLKKEALYLMALAPVTAASDTLQLQPGSEDAPFEPSNDLPEDGFSEGTAVLNTETTGDLVLHTDDGSIEFADGRVFRSPQVGFDPASGIGFHRISQSSGAPDIGVFTMAALNVAVGTELRGRGMAALGLISGSQAVIEGQIDVSSGRRACLGQGNSRRCPGPGGKAGGRSCAPCCQPCFSNFSGCANCPSVCECSECEPAEPGNGGGGSSGEGLCFPEAGGGGGGHGSFGGEGGSTESLLDASPIFLPGGVGGEAFGVAELVPLTGGGGGGGGGDENLQSTRGGRGGGGGGALQLVAAQRIVVRSTGSGLCGVDASGAGGAAGEFSAGGGGGGAGGGILLEALEVTVDADCVLAANGGGGGGSNNGENGVSGRMSIDPAAGGATFDFCASGPGGEGGAATSVAEDALSCPFDSPGCGLPGCSEVGGGGGGVGVIRINGDVVVVQGTVSPPHSTGSVDR